MFLKTVKSYNVTIKILFKLDNYQNKSSFAEDGDLKQEVNVWMFMWEQNIDKKK